MLKEKTQKIKLKRANLCIWDGDKRVTGCYEEKGEFYLTLWIDRCDPYWYDLAFDVDTEGSRIRMYSSCGNAIVRNGLELPEGMVLCERFEMVRCVCYNDRSVLEKRRIGYRKLFKRRSFLIHVLIGEITRT